MVVSLVPNDQNASVLYIPEEGRVVGKGELLKRLVNLLVVDDLERPKVVDVFKRSSAKTGNVVFYGSGATVVYLTNYEAC